MFQIEHLKRQVSELEAITKFLVLEFNNGNLQQLEYMDEKKGITYSLSIKEGKLIFSHSD